MAIQFDYLNFIMRLPKADLTLISGTLFELDTNAFRLEVEANQATEAGITFKSPTQHTTQVVVAGITYSRVIEIINGWQLEFEDGQYTVRLDGSNNNFFDVEGGILVQNQVSISPTNSAGLQVVEGVLTAAETAQLLAIYRDLGLDPSNPKTITEVVAESDFDEVVAGDTKEVRTVGDTTTLTTL